MDRELRRQVGELDPLGLFVAEGFNQDGAVLDLAAALPLRFPLILPAIEERRRASRGVYPEVFDIDAVLGKVEIGLVLALLRGREVVPIGVSVLVGDAVEVEEVGDLAFLEAADGFALQRADVELADVVVILAPVSELMLAPVRREPLLDSLIQRVRERVCCRRATPPRISGAAKDSVRVLCRGTGTACGTPTRTAPAGRPRSPGARVRLRCGRDGRGRPRGRR